MMVGSAPFQMTAGSWLGSIAAAARSSKERVAEVLKAHGIQPQPLLPRPRLVNVRSVRLEGRKHQDSNRFVFEWSELGPGLWALLSDQNSRGKSSILAAIRCALQGRFPGKMKPDVWGWLELIEVSFTIDAVTYVVTVTKRAGEFRESDAKVSLVRCEPGRATAALFEGVADDSFEQAMSDLFLEELGFSKFHAFRAAQGTTSEHGWPSMSSALFITGPGKAIFGDHVEDGLPIRLIQLFIGLPWISTYTAASAALKRHESQSKRRAAPQSTLAAKLSSRISSLNGELQRVESEIAALPDRGYIRAEMARLDALAAKAQAEITERRAALLAAEALLEGAKAGRAEAKRLLQQAKDEAAAGYVFRRLRPVCCPACEAGLEVGRFEATSGDTCGLCGNSEALPADEETDLTSLEQQVSDSEAAYKAALDGLESARKALADAEGRWGDVLAQLSAVQAALAQGDRREELVLARSAIEARIAELREAIGGEVEHGPPHEEDELLILRAAEIVTKKLMVDLQESILGDVSRELFDLSVRFGVQNLEGMVLKPNKLDILQGGASLTFTKLSPGECLRVRIAAALAVLKVARERGYGRHPGLIVMDSPGAQEMSDDDFSELVRATASAIEEVPGVQVLVGAVSRPFLREVVPVARRRECVGDEYMF